MELDQELRFRLTVRQPNAKAFLEALTSLPPELMPEFWFELEPNPKSKRIYLDKALDAYLARMAAAQCIHGTLRHKFYELRVDGFLDEGPMHPEATAYPKFWISDNSTYDSENTDEGRHSAEMEAACAHFLQSLDTHYAVYWTYDMRDALTAARERLFAEADLIPEGLRPNVVKLGGSRGDYAEAKISFPKLGWRSVLSDEVLTDYGLTHDMVADYAIEVTERGQSGSARLVEYRFFEHLADWPDHIDRLAELSHIADRARYHGQRFRDEIVPRRWHSVQHWPKWIKDGEIQWPGPWDGWG